MKHCPHCGTKNETEAPACIGCSITFAATPAVQMQGIGQAPTKVRKSTTPPTYRAEDELTEAEESRPRSATFHQRKAVTRQPSTAGPESAPEIPPGAKSITIGYQQGNDLVIPLPQVSGRHAELAAIGQRLILQDLGSTNGVFINGHRVDRSYIQPEDMIGLGSYEFKLTSELIDRVRSQVEEADLPVTRALTAIPEFGKKVVIGRELDCDIVIDAPQISRHHVELEWTGRAWRFRDLTTVNGTFLNDRNRRIDEGVVTPGDVLFFGSYRFPVSRLSSLIGSDATSTSSLLTLPANKPVLTVGRGTENDIVIDDPQVSRNHARLIRTDGGYAIEDLDSANGTYIAGVRVKRSELDPNQVVSFGTYGVIFDLKSGEVQKRYKGDIQIAADRLSVDVRNDGTKKRILSEVSFTAYPTEIVGILGPSGSGKTTLLMTLLGEISPTIGRRLVNGVDLIRNFDLYRGAIGYVPQEDIIHRELTVFEALYFAAKLRLPPDTSKKEITARIEEVLTQLEILETKSLQIGTPERKGISGGQRKRVNLAMELLTQPSLLCLDEPTSGLASEDALNVMRLLRRLADDGRTILLTIHQPSLRTYRILDNAMYLVDGQTTYYGPAYPESMLYFHPHVSEQSAESAEVLADPGSCMSVIMDAKRAGNVPTLVSDFRESKMHGDYIEQRREETADVQKPSKRKKRRFSFRQFWTLSRRYFAIRRKDKLGLFLVLVQAPVIGILLDSVFFSDTGGVMTRIADHPFALFMMVVSAIWFGCSNAAREIVSELPIYRRERMVNLSVGAYVLSKYAIIGGFCALQCLVLLGTTYFVLGFVGNFAYLWFTLWICSLAGVGMGLLLSAFTRTTYAATVAVPILLIPQIIFGGAIMPIDRMSAPVWGVSQTNISRWGFEGLLQAEHLGDAYELSIDDLPKSPIPGLPSPPAPENPIDRFFGDSETSLVFNWGIVCVFNLLMLFAVCLVLLVRDRKRRG